MKEKERLGIVCMYLLVIGIFVGIAQLTNMATSVIAERIPVSRIHTIVIDAGHGGEDGGTTSISNALESDINLEISLKLQDLFHLLGYRTKMIRTTDRSVCTQGETIASRKVSDLRQRVNMVNDTEGAILISIHQNTYPESKYRGAQVFYAAEGESRTLAEGIQTAFRDTINPGSNRKIKKAEGIYLMDKIRCTGVLVECGFLSNPEEDVLLQSSSYQQKICCIISSAVAGFLTK